MAITVTYGGNITNNDWREFKFKARPHIVSDGPTSYQDGWDWFMIAKCQAINGDILDVEFPVSGSKMIECLIDTGIRTQAVAETINKYL